MFEIASGGNSLDAPRAKIQEFLSLGTLVGVLVDPRTLVLEVCRTGAEAVILRDGDVLILPDWLPGWEMEVNSIWAPEFD